MAAITVNDIFRVVLWSQFDNQAGLLVSFWKATVLTGPGVTTDDLPKGFGDAFGPLLKAVMTDQAAYLGCLTARVFPGKTPQASSTSSNGVGTVGGDPLPRQVTGIVTLKTDTAGRAGRGRKYLPFPGEADNISGFGPTAGLVSRYADIATQFGTGLNITAGGDTVTLQAGVMPRNNPGAFKPLTGTQVRQKWATQRRRGTYGQSNVPPF